MITYFNNQETFFDFNMVTQLLQVHPSTLKRVLRDFNFPSGTKLKYKNRHLYSHRGVIELLKFMTENKQHLANTADAVNKINALK